MAAHKDIVQPDLKKNTLSGIGADAVPRIAYMMLEIKRLSSPQVVFALPKDILLMTEEEAIGRDG